MDFTETSTTNTREFTETDISDNRVSNLHHDPQYREFPAPGDGYLRKTTVGIKYEFLKHLLETESGCTLETAERTDGKILLTLKSKSGEVLSTVLLPDAGTRIIPNPEAPDKNLYSIQIGDDRYALVPNIEDVRVNGTTIVDKKIANIVMNKVHVSSSTPTIIAGDLWFDTSE